MKKFSLMLLMLWSSAVFAEASYNIGATSNYLWRGLEQTNGDAAIFGGIDYEDKSGFYVGTWVSNASWAEGMTYEIDLYGGYTFELDTVAFDIGYIYYAYPDEPTDTSDLSELYLNVGISDLTLGAAVLVSGEDADFGDTLYLSADYSVAVFNEAALNFHVGHYSGDWLVEDTTDIALSLSKNDFTFGVSKVDAEDADDVKFYVSYQLTFDL